MKISTMITIFKLSIRILLIGCVVILINACSSKKIIPTAASETLQKSIPSLEVSNLFKDHMVLQQNDHVAIFGNADIHDIVTVKGSWGESARSYSDDSGEWLAKINTPSAGGPFTLTIANSVESIQINDVMIGEVWLASGQSNMQMPVKGWPPNDPIDHSADEIASGSFPQIRMLTVTRNISTSPKDNFAGTWAVASPETVGDFSATAYFFARRLHQELNVPIGIIHSSWGGTVAEAWTSKEKLLTLGDFDQAISNMSESSNEADIEKWFSDKESRPSPTSEEGFAALNLNDRDALKRPYTSAKQINLPGRYDLIGESDMDGAFWMYKEIIIEDISVDYLFELGAVDDVDATYINGEKIGGISGYNIKREYNIPKAALRRGLNIIAIRAIDTGGPGTVTEPMSMTSTTGETISLAGDWLSVPAAEIYDGKFYIYDMNEDISKTRPNIVHQNPNIPTVLFNAMIHPLIPYSVKGAIWYQGESNVGRDQQYRKLFPALITDWRQAWGDNFPFYYVQIAPFEYGGSGNDQSQKLREAQRVSLGLDKTGMVVTMDIGNNKNIHPGNKQDVGSRLAGLALAHDYGKDLIASGPNYKSKITDGSSIILEFENVGSGLIAGDGGLTGFEIAGRNGHFKAAVAKIVGNQIVVSSVEVNDPVHVRYAWSDTGVATLFNAEGLPASSFRTRN